MSFQEVTYELTIRFLPISVPISHTKELVKAKLHMLGEVTYVEGVVDDLYLDFDHDQPDFDYYGEQNGDESPILIYKFDLSSLENLKTILEKEFTEVVSCQLKSTSTKEWQDGWKENFKPIVTPHFYLSPTWEKAPCPEDKIPLWMDPGMAFGTGQHETTRLCLAQIEQFYDQGLFRQPLKVLDVGTGSAILAIAAKKLGAVEVVGTDIDPDAVMVAKENARINNCEMTIQQGSIPDERNRYDIVIANILTVVLVKIFDTLLSTVKPGGYLVLSGLLIEDKESFDTLAAKADAKITRATSENDWGCLVVEKKA